MMFPVDFALSFCAPEKYSRKAMKILDFAMKGFVGGIHKKIGP